MRLNIDYVSLGIFIAAYVFAQIRAVPLRIRYLGLAAAAGAIAVVQLERAHWTFNSVFALLAVGIAVYYLVRAFRVPR